MGRRSGGEGGGSRHFGTPKSEPKVQTKIIAMLCRLFAQPNRQLDFSHSHAAATLPAGTPPAPSPAPAAPALLQANLRADKLQSGEVIAGQDEERSLLLGRLASCCLLIIVQLVLQVAVEG